MIDTEQLRREMSFIQSQRPFSALAMFSLRVYEEISDFTQTLATHLAQRDALPDPTATALALDALRARTTHRCSAHLLYSVMHSRVHGPHPMESIFEREQIIPTAKAAEAARRALQDYLDQHHPAVPGTENLVDEAAAMKTFLGRFPTTYPEGHPIAEGAQLAIDFLVAAEIACPAPWGEPIG